LGRIGEIVVRIECFEFPEGATPIADCSGLIPTWVHNLNDLNRVEAENISHAQRKYLKKSIADPKEWFFADELKAIHRIMFGNVWKWAGIYRKSVTSIGIQPSLISAQLGEFCLEVISWSQNPVELTFVEMAARIHHKLVFIHPFENGNGRFSRLIADRFLLAWHCSHPVWPSLSKESSARKEYIKTLKSADTGDYEPLIKFMEKLGACDPKPSDLLKNKFYKTRLSEEQIVSIETALLRKIKST
jgi:Fic-DOC domain mobile mystery protein B